MALPRLINAMCRRSCRRHCRGRSRSLDCRNGKQSEPEAAYQVDVAADYATAAASHPVPHAVMPRVRRVRRHAEARRAVVHRARCGGRCNRTSASHSQHIAHAYVAPLRPVAYRVDALQRAYMRRLHRRNTRWQQHAHNCKHREYQPSERHTRDIVCLQSYTFFYKRQKNISFPCFHSVRNILQRVAV